MNPHDRLDALLNSSAPDAIPISDHLTRELDAIAALAKTQAVSERASSGRSPRLMIGLGLAVLLTGGAGAAAAAGGFDWLPWAQDPDAVYAFTLPSGRACEIRSVIGHSDAEYPGDQEPGSEGDVVPESEYPGDWDAFVTRAGSLTVNDAEVERWVSEIRAEPHAIEAELGSDGQLHDNIDGSVPTDDDWYAIAHTFAYGRALDALAADSGVVYWVGDDQLQCEVVAP